MKLELFATARTARDPGPAFEFVTDSPQFPRFFPGNLLIPAVEQVEVLDPPQRPGTIRKVRVADGSLVTERVDVFDAPTEHAYSLIDGFRPPSSWLFSGAQARWRLRPERNGTRIDWYYTYHVRNALVYPLAWLVMKLGFQRAMQDCLQRMVRELDS